jgi:hypothetical protein
VKAFETEVLTGCLSLSMEMAERHSGSEKEWKKEKD